MSLSNVRAKLLAKLNDMQSLKAAFDYEAANSDGKYPFATLTLRDGTGSFESTAHNLRRRGFTVRVYQEQTKAGQGPQNAERIATETIDELEQALDMDTTLSGTVKYVTPISWRAVYQKRGTSTRILVIDIDALELVESS